MPGLLPQFFTMDFFRLVISGELRGEDSGDEVCGGSRGSASCAMIDDELALSPQHLNSFFSSNATLCRGWIGQG
jgi:hypothetical protein